MSKGEDGNLDDFGNWRVTVPEDEHGVIYLDGGDGSGSGNELEGAMVVDNTNYMVAVIILVVTAGVGIIAATILYFMRANT